jgi:hypothetical protein
MGKSGDEFGWHRKQLKKEWEKKKLNVPPTTVYRIAYDVNTDNTIRENFKFFLFLGKQRAKSPKI